jgi:hypothetical protein
LEDYFGAFKILLLQIYRTAFLQIPGIIERLSEIIETYKISFDVSYNSNNCFFGILDIHKKRKYG